MKAPGRLLIVDERIVAHGPAARRLPRPAGVICARERLWRANAPLPGRSLLRPINEHTTLPRTRLASLWPDRTQKASSDRIGEPREIERELGASQLNPLSRVDDDGLSSEHGLPSAAGLQLS